MIEDCGRQDWSIMNDDEIVVNIVEECGRHERRILMI